MRNKYIALSMLLLAFVSCQKHEPDPEIAGGSEICLNIDGKRILTYEPANWQTSYASGINKYRVYSDDMKNYYRLVAKEHPDRVGQEFKAKLSWGIDGVEDNISNDLKFTVTKMDQESGTIWLWCYRKQIGLAVIE